jgi:hypothetical protein
MRAPFCVLALFALATASAQPPRFTCSWLSRIPVTGVESEEVPSSDIYVLDAPAVSTASANELSSRDFVVLSPDRAELLTTGRYRTQTGKRPYLIRAVYWKARGPRYGVSYRGSQVTATLSPGWATGDCHKAALIVNLPFAPSEIYFGLWGGQ